MATLSFSQELKHSDLATLTSSSGRVTSYVSSDGSVYKIGDKIKIGIPNFGSAFTFITEGDGVFLPKTPLKASASGQETEIKNIWVYGNKRAGYTVTFHTKGISALSNYDILFENAVSVGEVKGFGKTSDEALTELKKAKDKLDLGLIDQAEFDRLKSELSKYIK